VGLESRIGVQAVFDFGSDFSVTAQEVARLRGSNEFDPGTEWLFVQYVPDSDWKLRVGRVELATFLFSDSREVGYAATWFRAPNEIYAAEPFNYLDGGQVLWQHGLGPAVIRLQSSYGTTKQTFEINGASFPTSANYVFNASAAVEYGNVLLRVAQTEVSTPITIPLSATYAVTYNVVDKFTSAGVQYDDGRAIALGEWAKRTENTGPGLPLPLTTSTQWYVAGGWRFGKLTPLLVYSKTMPNASLESPKGDFATWSSTLRYDIVSNLALKAQITRAQAANLIDWVTANAASNARINVYSFGADFVF
jgi:hypothetical protein